MALNSMPPGATTILSELAIRNNPDAVVVDISRVRGGNFVVATLEERDLIPTEIRKNRSTRCFVEETGFYYELRDGLANTNWVLIQDGGSSELLSNGQIKTELLPSIFFAGLNGTGTESDPFVFSNNQSVYDYLVSLPGFGPDKVLSSNMTWVDASGISTGGSGGGSAPVKLATPTLAFRNITATGGDVEWTAVTDATSYTLYRSKSATFSTFDTVYTGANLQFQETTLESSTQYYYRVRATASGFTSSDFGTGSFTTVEPGGAVEITQFTYLAGLTVQNENDLLVNVVADGGTAALAVKLASGQSGWISHTIPTFDIAGEASTGYLFAGLGLDPFYGGSDCIIGMLALDNGQVLGRYNQGEYFTGTVGATGPGGILRMRFDADNAYMEVSNNNGATYTILNTVPRPVGDIRFKVAISGNQRRVVNLRGLNLTAA